jgi:hypothetical protein
VWGYQQFGIDEHGFLAFFVLDPIATEEFNRESLVAYENIYAWFRKCHATPVYDYLGAKDRFAAIPPSHRQSELAGCGRIVCTSGLDPLLPFASGSYGVVLDPRLLDSIDNLPTTVTTFPGAFQRDIAVA